MPVLERFSVDDLVLVGRRLREGAAAAATMEASARYIVRHLYDELSDDDGQRACVLVRFYKTHSFSALPETLQVLARSRSGVDVGPDVKCLTLLATAGEEPAWNDRRLSRDHQAIPLLSAAVVEESPMIAELLNQMGVGAATVIRPGPKVSADFHHAMYNVFHVPDAVGSRSVPAQDDFVVPYGVHSVVGFGGALPSGDVFATIIFSRVLVDQKVADLFRSLAVAAKAAVIPHTLKVFDES